MHYKLKIVELNFVWLLLSEMLKKDIFRSEIGFSSLRVHFSFFVHGGVFVFVVCLTQNDFPVLFSSIRLGSHLCSFAFGRLCWAFCAFAHTNCILFYFF